MNKKQTKIIKKIAKDYKIKDHKTQYIYSEINSVNKLFWTIKWVFEDHIEVIPVLLPKHTKWLEKHFTEYIGVVLCDD